ncbi:hypothetical protein Tco_0301058 [Tanacetum coccineum]
MNRSSTESKTSLTIAANLFELDLKNILIDKMESNKSIYRSDEQKNLYKVLVDTYESDKLILDTYGDTVSFKIRRDDEDKDEEPSAGSNRGSKRRRARKEPESTNAPKEKTSKTSGKSYEGSKSQHKTAGESAQTEEPMHTTKDLEEPAHQEFETGRPTKLRSPDRDWNKTLLDAHRPVQPCLSSLAQIEDLLISRHTTYKSDKGSCKSLVELEYFFEEVYKATTDQLDWNNPESQQYPHDLRKPLPLIPNSRGRCVIPFDHLINNDLAYLSGLFKWIEDLVPNIIWNQVLVSYDKHPLWGISHWGHGFAANRESARDYLDWITVRRDDDKLYKFKEGDFNRLRIQDIEDMLLLLVQGKLTNLTVEERLAFNNKDKKNRLMRIDELHKFSDGTLNDVRTALNDRLKGIRMKYLPQTIWRQSDRD